MSDVERRLAELEAIVKNLVRTGEVTAVSPGYARVEFKDRSELVSYELPLLVKQTLKNKDSYTPDIGEHVTCVFLPNGIEQGFILGAFYSDADTVENEDPDIRQTKFNDGSTFSYDRKNNALTVTIVGEGVANINCKTATVTATESVTLATPTTTCTGDLIVEKSITYGEGMTGTGGATINGDFAAQGGAFTHNSKNVGSDHKHSGIQPGGSNTGDPV